MVSLIPSKQNLCAMGTPASTILKSDFYRDGVTSAVKEGIDKTSPLNKRVVNEAGLPPL